MRPSDAYQLDVASREFGQRLHVIGIGRDDGIAVDGEQHEGRIDHIRDCGPREQGAGRTPEAVIEWANLDSGQGPSQVCLAWTPSPPSLADHSPVRNRDLFGEHGGFQATPHGAIISFQRDQRPTVEDEPQAVPVRPRLTRARSADPRTTTADVRSARACSIISCREISPKSAS